MDGEIMQTTISIETLILVAVWKQPFVFQGYFKILDKSTQQGQVLFFRCEYAISALCKTIEEAFTPDHYCFTELYNEARTLQLHDLETTVDATYVLKYALHTTLCLMIKNQKQYFLSIDEVAMDLIIEKLRPAFSQASLGADDSDIGFAVTMDFNPTEQTGHNAVLALLGKNAGQSGLH